MLKQDDCVFHEDHGDYILQQDTSGMYSVWFLEDGKWQGLAVCRTVSAAHRTIKEHEGYMSAITALEHEGEQHCEHCMAILSFSNKAQQSYCPNCNNEG